MNPNHTTAAAKAYRKMLLMNDPTDLDLRRIYEPEKVEEEKMRERGRLIQILSSHPVSVEKKLGQGDTHSPGTFTPSRELLGKCGAVATENFATETRPVTCRRCLRILNGLAIDRSNLVDFIKGIHED